LTLVLVVTCQCAVTVKVIKFELEHPSCWQYPLPLPIIIGLDTRWHWHSYRVDRRLLSISPSITFRLGVDFIFSAVVVSQPCAAAPQMGQRASLSIHGPDRRRSHYAIGHSPPTLRVGRNLHEHRLAGGPFVSSTRDQGRDGPLSPSGQLAEVDVTSGG
jgi:hypothetical protein